MGTISDFVAAFDRDRNIYLTIEKEVEALCKEALRDIEFLWQSRVKASESLETILRGRNKDYEDESENVADVKDLVAGRIILARSLDFENVEEIMKQNFYIRGRLHYPKYGQNAVNSQARFRGYDGEIALAATGKYLTPSVSFALGVRDNPVHLPRKPYLTRLNELRHKILVFWDTEAKRGVLVNGLDGLLHLLRATLKHYETDEYMRSVLVSKSENIAEPKSENPFKPSTESGTYAFNILRDENNMKLPILPDKDDVEMESEDPKLVRRKKKFVRLEDRVEELYGILKILIDHQLEKAGQSGMRIKTHARRRLEGWDFKDLVSDNDPIFPLVETIEAVSKGWVDFIRSIQAVSLFGKGFGDILQPSDIIYSHWRQLSEGKFYLAARVSDLEMLMETKNGDDMAVPRRICDGISWFSPTPPSEPCPCSNLRARRHSNPVQVLWPTSLTNRLSLTKRVPLHPEGAVIFGHNARFKWSWGDHGDPVEGDPTVKPVEPGRIKSP